MAQNLPNPLIQEDFVSPERKLTRMALQWLQRVVDTTNRLNAAVQSGAVANPNGQIAAPVGSLYLSSHGGAGTTLWVKESGGSTTAGWIGK